MKKLQVIQVTMQDIWNVTCPMVHKSKKSYSRKIKHKRGENDG
jgi:hypothetical protein